MRFKDTNARDCCADVDFLNVYCACSGRIRHAFLAVSVRCVLAVTVRRAAEEKKKVNKLSSSFPFRFSKKDKLTPEKVKDNFG